MADATSRYLELVASRRWRVLGVPLVRMTLGHSHVLAEATGWRPLEGSTIDGETFVTGLFICSRPWRRAQRGLGRWPADVFGWRLGLLSALAGADLSEKAEVFAQYLDINAGGPRVAANVSDGRPRGPGRMYGSALLARLRLFACERLGERWDTAMDVPMAELLTLWAAHGEASESFRVLNDQDLSFDEFCRQEDAKREVGACS